MSDETEDEQQLAPNRIHSGKARGGPGGAVQHPPASQEAPEEEDPRKIATGSTLADISIRNHVFAWMLMAALKKVI